MRTWTNCRRSGAQRPLEEWRGRYFPLVFRGIIYNVDDVERARKAIKGTEGKRLTCRRIVGAEEATDSHSLKKSWGRPRKEATMLRSSLARADRS